MKQKPEEKPITARPVGQSYWVQQSGKESKSRFKKGEMDSQNQLQYGAGCFRRMPTNKE